MRITQAQRILEALRKGPLLTTDFYEHSCPNCGFGKGLNIPKYSSRIADLRRRGYIIEAKKTGKGNVHRYELVHEPVTIEVKLEEVEVEVERDESGKLVEVHSQPLLPMNEPPKPPRAYR